MEENQITCPQCGLMNNCLADACVQCGIIFVKDPAMKLAAATLGDEKRKAIEAAEAILDETQPSIASAAPDNEMIKQPDLHEDTLESRIPQAEEIPLIEVESSDSEATEPEENKQTQNTEIELEAIETAIETVTGPTDALTHFLWDVKADEPAEPAAVESAEKSADTPGNPKKEADEPVKTDKSVSANEDSHDSKTGDTAAKQFEAGAMAADESTEILLTSEFEKAQAESTAPAEAEASAHKPAEPINSEDKSTPEVESQPVEPEIILETESEVTPVEYGTDQTEAQADVPASIEMPDKTTEADVQAKQQAKKARQEALIKQQEALLKAEARKKEEAARAKAAALKKKKLTRAKAEALKKQKAAQAKAEALKKKKASQDEALALEKQKASQARLDALEKQKKAQAKAEISAGDMQVAAADRSNHAKFLGLLQRYEGKAIGINYDNSAEIKEAELVEANEEFFSVKVKDKKVQYSYPLKTILTIVEGEQGVETGEDDNKAKFDAVIKVYPLVLF